MDKKIKQFLIDLPFLVVACAFGAFGLYGVMMPNGLTYGGLTGIARVIEHFTHWNFSVIYYGESLIILALAFFFLGFKEARKIVLLALLYPATIVVFEHIPFGLLESKDVILAAIFLGIFNGLSYGLAIWRGYSYGGTDTIAKILKKKLFPEISISKFLLVIDSVIIVLSGFIFGRNIALYALITQYITSKTVDAVIFGFETKVVCVDIVAANDAEGTASYIMKEIGRGVSETRIIGAYTGAEHLKLTTYCSLRESTLIRRYIAEHDPKAFVTVERVDTVWGDGTGFHRIEQE